jgi:cytochrome c peroxidase
MKILPYVLLIAGVSVGLANCKKEQSGNDPYKYQSEVLNLPETPFNYRNQSLPQHFFEAQTGIQQKVTDHGATLGRVLFYDPKLSLTNKTACASCHLQANGFADPKALSVGFDGGLTKRNSSAIINPIDNANFFWDARENNLKTMVLKPIENHVEMGMDNFDALERKLGQLDYYEPLFANAFGDSRVTKERIAEALSQFLNSLFTGNSKFDESNPGSWGVGNTLVFNEDELRGMEVFFNQGRCANCHNPSGSFAFLMEEHFADIGLDATPTDIGLGANQPGMDGMFKIPSLRNVALTAPYMHDGRFATLEQVIDHYNEGIQASPNLNWALRSGSTGTEPLRMGLTEQQQSDLVAFLHTLTDATFIKDPKFSSPFK